ncbi:CAP domain-containing protein [Trichocoleus sp. FACHB-262]|uniref:CAP domain-containing protein n=1 Tax=Trichocoleus sp. FACHB-262 TaxID=2692869 RepID=UPI001685A755|nr:CAP domain-containing protein [Trichocoleus sp. FACHB-262]MBD2124267.1 CAP domain-containing protein [Trichocoleus sp. FACHB-262]
MSSLSSRSSRSSWRKTCPKQVWLSYAALFAVLWTIPPVFHYIKQAQRGHPLDAHYFWAELSPEKVFHLGLYNGPGGSNWKIGLPIATLWTASAPRSLPELQKLGLEVMNRDRQLNGLPTLVEDPLLSQAAQLHAQDMMNRHYFAHNSLEGRTPTERFHAIGGAPRVGVGENIIYVQDSSVGLTYRDIEMFQKGWMYSNGHRDNILKPEYVKFGYGIVIDPVSGRKFAAQEFAVPAPTP